MSKKSFLPVLPDKKIYNLERNDYFFCYLPAVQREHSVGVVRPAVSLYRPASHFGVSDPGI